jgi:PTS system N-acetylglucosamine-specific IIC component
VPDATFAAEIMGSGIAIDPPREVVEAVAPVSGTIIQLWPHAFIVATADEVGVLVHLGIDTVQLQGEGFTTHAAAGDQVTAGQKVITYDVPTVERLERNPIIPVIVVDSKAETLELIAAIDAEVTEGQDLITRIG